MGARGDRSVPTRRLASSVVAAAALFVVACVGPHGRSATASSEALPSPPAVERSTAEREGPGVATAPAPALLPVSIATGDPRETDFRIGRDIATQVAPRAGIALNVLATKGSADNLHRLTDEGDVDLAIAQYDVIQALIDEAGRGNAAARRIVRPLRIVMPLYTQELYFVVRSDAPMKSIQDIRGKRINVGVQGSGSALTVAALYRQMFHTPIAPHAVHYLGDDQALAALTVERSVDVVVIVAAQPARVFTDMKPAARGYIRLLPFDPRAASSDDALKQYFPAKLLARNYPALLTTDVPTLSVMSFLVTSDRPGNALTPRLADLARAFCASLPTLRSTGHPKWREVEPGQRFGFRWAYASASQTEFERCARPAPSPAQASNP